MKAQRTGWIAIAIIIALVVGILPARGVSAVPYKGGAATVFGDVLFNGDFEEGFMANDACGGMVGKGWGCFHNGGTAAYGFFDDQWDPVVYSGEHSQLIEINTLQAGGDNDRNAGIFQKVSVWPNYEYELSLKGIIRAQDHGGDPWRYRVYVGFDYEGDTDWRAVTDWRELPWDTYYDRLNPGSFSSFTTKVKPTNDTLTVFIRVQRKWGTWYEETDFNLDAISLYGPVEVAAAVQPPTPEPTPQPAAEEAPAPAELECTGDNLLKNGGFEAGFQDNGVAQEWTGFNNGGHVNYGYYDEMWAPVVSEGEHGQLIEINTLHVGDTTEPNRMAGIYQKVWLEPGATYEISFAAMMRERRDHSDEDFYRYMVEWGYSKDGGTDPTQMDFRERVPLEHIYLRTAPGQMQPFSARFKAPSETTTIWIFALKKWATLERELDVNIDNVVLRRCGKKKVTPTPTPTVPTGKAAWCGPGNVWYVVQRGDTMSALAQTFGTTVQAIQEKNHIANPNWIYAGQVLCIPDAPGSSGVVAPAAPAEPQPAPPSSPPSAPTQPGDNVLTYRVQRGDTLSEIAVRFNTTVEVLMSLNNISDPHWIYVGQMLRLPS